MPHLCTVNDTKRFRYRNTQRKREINKKVTNIEKQKVMGAAILFTLIILPILVSFAFVLVIVMGRVRLQSTAYSCEEVDVEVYASSPAVLTA